MAEIFKNTPNDSSSNIEASKNSNIGNSENLNEAENTVQKVQATTVDYIPESKACFSLKVSTPLKQRYEIKKSLEGISRRVKNVDFYVAEKLGYLDEKGNPDINRLCYRPTDNEPNLSAEQVDALALAIHNLEEKGVGLIIGDQTGIGKGRIAAGLIRYGKHNKRRVIFITEKPNLFSDIYRDLNDIGSDDLIPMEIYDDKNPKNIKEKKVFPSDDEILDRILQDIENGEFNYPDLNAQLITIDEDEDEIKKAIKFYKNEVIEPEIVREVKRVKISKEAYEEAIRPANQVVPFIISSDIRRASIISPERHIIYKPLPTDKQKDVFNDISLLEDYDVILTTYSQFSAPKNPKKQFLSMIFDGALVVMDESHNASGTSKRSDFLKEAISRAKGVIYLSATYAKRPENMPIYSIGTSIKKTELGSAEITSIFNQYGVPLQEVVSAMLVKQGEYIRRERTFAGVKTDYLIMNDSLESIGLNKKEEHYALADPITEILRDIIYFQKNYIDPLLKDKTGSLLSPDLTISKAPAFSTVFNTINQLLLCVKAKDVAQLAINELKKGKKVMIAIYNTMESALNNLRTDEGFIGSIGSEVELTFRSLLTLKLEKALQYKVVNNVTGETEIKQIKVEDLSPEARMEYDQIVNKIASFQSDLVSTPLDLVKYMIKQAGFSVEEATGRKTEIEFITPTRGKLISRKGSPINEIYFRFNDNETDCVIFNSVGATGASAQAKTTKKVPFIKTNYGYVTTITDLKEGERVVVPESLEPRNEVKQRVMISLQPDLDINVEIQKRGRIHRTGQVLLPEYKYVSSDIPAERRLFMMLQKKLKSLDANTSSNQKQSKEVIDVSDFLNIIGDQVVLNFLKTEGAFYTLLLGEDPLVIDEMKSAPEGFASRIAGRVAILSTKQQEDFYDQVIDLYSNEIKRLNALDQNPLESSYLDYQATLLDIRPLVSGNESGNIFEKPLYLGEFEVNNLRKPMTADIIVNEIKEFLTVRTDSNETIGNLTSTDVRDNLVSKADSYLESHRSEIIKIYEDMAVQRKEKLEKELKQKHEEKIKKLTKEKADQADIIHEEEKFKAALEALPEQIDDWRKVRTSKEIEELETTVRRFQRIISRLSIGSIYDYPIEKDEKENVKRQMAILSGIFIDNKTKNPFMPSNVRFRFLFASSVVKLEVNMSEIIKIEDLIIQNRYYNFQNEYNVSEFVEFWNYEVRSLSASRIRKQIAIGNPFKVGKINQEKRPNIIEFTVVSPNGKTQIIKGFEFSSDSASATRINSFVKIQDAAKFIMAESKRSAVQLNDAYVYQDSLGYYIFSFSRNSNPEIFKDERLKDISVEGTFREFRDGKEKKMNIKFSFENVTEACELLGQYGIMVSVPPNLYATYFPYTAELDIDQFLDEEVEENDATDQLNEELDLYTKEQEEQQKREQQEKEEADRKEALAEAMERKLFKLLKIIRNGGK